MQTELRSGAVDQKVPSLMSTPPSVSYEPNTPDFALGSLSGASRRSFFGASSDVSSGMDREVFWQALFTRGVVHHTLYSQIQDLIRADGASSGHPAPMTRFATVAAHLSAVAAGRKILIPFLHNLSWDERLALHDAWAPTALPGHLPLPLALSSLQPSVDLLRTAHSSVLQRWWSVIESQFQTPTGRSKKATPVETSPRPQATTVSLSLLSQNVWGVPGLTKYPAARFAALGEMLQRSSFDIVALQEMWDKRTQLILDRAEFPYIATTTGFPGLTYRAGLAICSRHPIIETFQLTFKNFGGIESAVRKGALACRIALPQGNTILVITTHLVSPTERLSHVLCSERRTAALRIAQIKELGNWIDSFARHPGEDCIVLGDFNAPEFSAEYREMIKLIGRDIFRERMPYKGSSTGDRRQVAKDPDERARQGVTFSAELNRFVRTDECARLDYTLGRFADPDAVDIGVDLLSGNSAFPFSDHLGVVTHYKRQLDLISPNLPSGASAALEAIKLDSQNTELRI